MARPGNSFFGVLSVVYYGTMNWVWFHQCFLDGFVWFRWFNELLFVLLGAIVVVSVLGDGFFFSSVLDSCFLIHTICVFEIDGVWTIFNHHYLVSVGVSSSLSCETMIRLWFCQNFLDGFLWFGWFNQQSCVVLESSSSWLYCCY